MNMMLTKHGTLSPKRGKKIKRKKWEEWAQTRARKQLNLTETYTPAHSVNLSSSECTGVCKKEHTKKKKDWKDGGERAVDSSEPSRSR